MIDYNLVNVPAPEVVVNDVQSFDIECKEIVKTIADLEVEHGFYG
jgi:hypothetical protein